MLPGELPGRYLPVTTLGAPVRVYVLPDRKLAIRVLSMLALLGGGATWLALRITGSAGLAGAWWFLAPALILAGLAVGWGTWRRVRASAVAYEEGFAYSDGGEVGAYRYEEIALFRSVVIVKRSLGVRVRTRHQYPITMKSGERFILTGYLSKVADLARRIREATFPLLFPGYAEAYNRGETLDFGPLRIGKELGVEVEGRPIRWAEIEKIDVRGGYLTIAGRGKGGPQLSDHNGRSWTSALSITRGGRGVVYGSAVPASSIPNLDILMAISDQALTPVPSLPSDTG
jgi:hypothetical protein